MTSILLTHHRAKDVIAGIPKLLLTEFQSAQDGTLLGNAFRRLKTTYEQLNARREASAELSPGKPKPRLPKWEDFVYERVCQSVDWAYASWLAVYIALTTRREVHSAEYAGKAMYNYVSLYARLGLCDLAHTYLKFHSAYVFAAAAQQEELPERPSTWQQVTDEFCNGNMVEGIVAGGWVYSLVRPLLRKRCSGKPNSRHLDLAYDFLMLKRGCPVLAKHLIEKAYLDHRTALTEEHKRPENSEVLRGKVKAAIKRTCRSLFQGWRIDDINLSPSGNASFENTRGDGGQVGTLALIIALSSHREGIPEMTTEERAQVRQRVAMVSKTPSTDEFLGLDRLVDFGEFRPSASPTFGGVPAEEVVKKVQMAIDESIQGGQGKVELSCRETGETAFVNAIRRNRCKPCCIPEPLKLRMITMGEGDLYYRALSVQQTWWKRMKTFSPFRYTGRPIDDMDWDMFWAQWRYSQSTLFVSGDYSAATDNLDPEMSEYTLKQIFKLYRSQDELALKKRLYELSKLLQDMWSDEEFDELVKRADACGRELAELRHERSELGMLGLRCMVAHDLANVCDGTGKEDGRQRWGQLMGSPLSFPVLNIINFATTCTALGERVEPMLGGAEGCGRRHIPTRPILTNGDDIAFVCTREEYGVWNQYVRAVGLYPSLGKNYTSQHFAIINSQLRMVPQALFSAWADCQTKRCCIPFVGLKRELEAKPSKKHPAYRWGELTPLEMNGGEVEDLWSLFTNSPVRGCGWTAGLHWEFKPFVNQTLLLGREGKGPKAGKDLRDGLTYAEAGDRCYSLVHGFTNETERDRLIMCFVENHRITLSRCPPNASWYLPSSLGGAGLPKPSRVQIPENHLRYAAKVLSRGLEARAPLTSVCPSKPDLQKAFAREAAEILGLKTTQVPAYRPSGAQALPPKNAGVASLLGAISLLRSNGWSAARVYGGLLFDFLIQKARLNPDGKAAKLPKIQEFLERSRGMSHEQAKEDFAQQWWFWSLSDVPKKETTGPYEEEAYLDGWEREKACKVRSTWKKLTRGALPAVAMGEEKALAYGNIAWVEVQEQCLYFELPKEHTVFRDPQKVFARFDTTKSDYDRLTETPEALVLASPWKPRSPWLME